MMIKINSPRNQTYVPTHSEDPVIRVLEERIDHLANQILATIEDLENQDTEALAKLLDRKIVCLKDERNFFIEIRDRIPKREPRFEALKEPDKKIRRGNRYDCKPHVRTQSKDPVVCVLEEEIASLAKQILAVKIDLLNQRTKDPVELLCQEISYLRSKRDFFIEATDRILQRVPEFKSFKEPEKVTDRTGSRLAKKSRSERRKETDRVPKEKKADPIFITEKHKKTTPNIPAVHAVREGLFLMLGLARKIIPLFQRISSSAYRLFQSMGESCRAAVEPKKKES